MDVNRQEAYATPRHLREESLKWWKWRYLSKNENAFCFGGGTRNWKWVQLLATTQPHMTSSASAFIYYNNTTSLFPLLSSPLLSSPPFAS
jgi:hypothetical protein